MRLVISPVAASAIRYLPPAVKRAVREALRSVGRDPACGEPLQRELAGYFKFRVRRFRIVYTVDRLRRTVRILAVGPRSTIYEEVADQLSAGRAGAGEQ